MLCPNKEILNNYNYFYWNYSNYCPSAHVNRRAVHVCEVIWGLHKQYQNPRAHQVSARVAGGFCHSPDFPATTQTQCARQLTWHRWLWGGHELPVGGKCASVGLHGSRLGGR